MSAIGYSLLNVEVHADIDGRIDGMAALGGRGETPLFQARKQQPIQCRIVRRAKQGDFALAVRMHGKARECDGREGFVACFVRNRGQGLRQRARMTASCA